MVYKKYIKRDGKIFGPYYYESYRDKKGNVKTRYVYEAENITPKEKKEIIRAPGKIFAMILVAVLLVLIIAGYFIIGGGSSKVASVGASIFGFANNFYMSVTEIVSEEFGTSEGTSSESGAETPVEGGEIIQTKPKPAPEEIVAPSEPLPETSPEPSPETLPEPSPETVEEAPQEQPITPEKIKPEQQPIAAASTPGPISTCQNLDTPGEYTLTSNVSNYNGDCFNISTSNVVLDLAGYYVFGNNSVSSRGVYISGARTNITVKNGVIDGFGKNTASGYGFYSSYDANNNVLNNITFSNSYYGVYSAGNSNNSFFNLFLFNNSNYGMNLFGTEAPNYHPSNNNRIENITAIYNSLGFYFLLISNFSVRNITANNNTNGFLFGTTPLNNSSGITANFNSQTGLAMYAASISLINISLIGNNYGLELPCNSNFLTFENITAISNIGADVYLSCDSAHSLFRNYDIRTIKTETGYVATFGLEKPEYGKIKYLRNVYTQGTANISRDIILANNSIYVNGSATGLNVSANITLYNIGNRGFARPAILKDGVLCGSACYNFTSLNASTVIFNVSSWSNYSIGESPIIGYCPGGMIGYGNASSPCQITTWTQLNATRNNLTASYILMNNLSSSSAGYSGLGDNWQPIGTYPGAPFSGNFNGNEYTISNLTINKPGVDYVGLFAYINGTISNVNLIVLNVTGQYKVGGLAGHSWSTISNCSVTVLGTVSAQNYYAGGLVGYSPNGIISNSSAIISGRVSAITQYPAGGLVGYSGATISGSSAIITGTVSSGNNRAGGLVGLSGGIISNSSATVSGNVSGGSTVGGLVGEGVGIISNSSATISGIVSGTFIVGGLIGGHGSGGIISNSFTTIMGTVSASGQIAGGFVGQNTGTISNSSATIYDTANLMASSNLGLIAGIFTGGTVTSTYGTVYDSQFGNITFLDWNVTKIDGGNLRDYIYLNNNSAFVNGSIAGFNKSANITLYNLGNRGFARPTILKDGVPCGSACYNFTALTASTVIFNVSSWSNYSIGEGTGGQQGIPPNATEFTLAYGSTNFSNVTDLFNITNLTLSNANGKIQFPSSYSINVSGQDYDANIEIGNGFVSVNASALHPNFNATADITINNVQCPVSVYSTDGFFTTASDIRQNGTACTSCSNIVCNAGAHTLTFTTSHFSGFVTVSTCGTLNESNTVYTLTNNISTTGTCFNITADNVTLDGNGYTLTGPGSIVQIRYGIYATGRNNITLKNFANIGNYGRFGYGGSAIYLNNVNNSFVQNLSITSNTDNAFIMVSSHNNNLANLIISSNANSGLYINSNSNNNTIVNATVNSNPYGGIILSSSSNNNILNSTSNFNSNGIILISSSNNNILNSTSNFNSNGIYSISSSNNNFTGLSANSNSVDIYLSSTNYEAFSGYNFSSYNFTNVLGVSFEYAPFGKIKFRPGINATGTNFMTSLIILNNSVYVNSSVGGLNKSANITLYNLGNRGFARPTILKDGVPCGSACYNFTALTASTVIFNVSSWSNYSIGESPGICPNNWAGDGTQANPCNVTECNKLNVSNLYYQLIDNETINGVCFNITANNVTLDGRGFTITGNISAIKPGNNENAYDNFTLLNSRLDGSILSIGSNGGFGAAGGFGGSITLINSTAHQLFSMGGTGGGIGNGGLGGKIVVVNSSLQYVTSLGGNGGSSGNGNSGGEIIIINSNISTINASGGLSGSASSTFGGAGGNVNITNSFISGSITTVGRDGYSGADGGSVWISNSRAEDITGIGGKADMTFGTRGGAGGSVTITNSTTGTIHISGGDGHFGLGGVAGGAGGSVTAIDSNIAHVVSVGGSGILSSGGNGGSVSLTNVEFNLSYIIDIAAGANATILVHDGNLTLNKSSLINNFGSVKFNFIRSTKTNFTSIIRIANNLAYVNSTSYGDYNVSANVTLNGISGYTHLVILKDGVACWAPSCNLLSYIGDTVVFNVTSWSNYTLANDSSAPLIEILAPANMTVTNQTTFNFTANITEVGPAGLANATLYIFNSTGLYYNGTVIIPGAPLQATVGIVVTLVEGIYSWFWEALDLVGNLASTQTTVGNYTITVLNYCPGGMIGYGNASSPCQITTWTQLNATRNNLTLSYALTANLDYSSPGYSGLGDNWQPIGTFSGSFNGNGYTISNLTINKSAVLYVGFFGSSSGNISNLSIIIASMSSGAYSGGLVGQSSGRILNSSVTISGSFIGGSQRIGGLVGENSGTIIDSSSIISGVISASVQSVGGLVGYNYGTGIINHSYSSVSGNVSAPRCAGGLVGNNLYGGNILNSSAIISGNILSSGDSAGGLVCSNSGTVRDSSSIVSGKVSATNYAGGLVGRGEGWIDSSSAIISGTISSSSYSGGLVGWIQSSGGVNHSSVIVSGTISASSYSGFLAGSNARPINNASAISETSATVNGTTFVGFIGTNVGTVLNSYLKIRNTTYGNITFLDWNVTKADGGNLLQQIYIANNSVYVNGSISGLNKSANITLTGINGYTHLVILKDGVACRAPSCNLLSYIGDVVTFNVTSWSNYTLANDSSAPLIEILAPLNMTITNQTTFNFTANITEVGAGLANATLYIFNQTGLYYNGTIIFTGAPLQATVGIVVTLVEGIYSWFWEALDLVGNLASTQISPGNYTITVDVTSPLITIVSPANQTYNNETIIVNIAATDPSNTNIDRVWFDWNGTIQYYSLGSPVLVTFPSGTTTLHAYANDSAGNVNHTQVTFNVNKTNLTFCRVLDIENEVYTLTQGIGGVVGTCFIINATNVTLNMNGYGVVGDDVGVDYCVYSDGYNNSVIKDGTCNHFGTGIYLANNRDNTIFNMITNVNTITGVTLQASNANNVTGSNLNNNYDGIFVNSSINNRIINNTINANTQYGVYLSSSNSTLLENNKIKNNGNSGIYIDPSYYNSMINNEVDNNAASGIELYQSSFNNIINNTVSNNSNSGIEAFQSDDNVMLNNSIFGNKYGIDVSVASRNTLWNNNIYSNTNESILDPSPVYTNYLVYNNSFGEIRWTNSTFLNTMSLKGDLIFGNGSGDTISIGQDYAYVKSEAFTVGNINSSANITLKLLNNTYRGQYPALLRKMLKDGGECGNACVNFTSLTNSQVRFAVNSWSNYSIGKYVRSKSEIPISTGWNMISLTMEENETNEDINISISVGWNLIGYSSDAEFALDNATFTNSTGENETFNNAAKKGKLQKYVSYLDKDIANGANSKKYKFVGKTNSDSKLKKHKGYWIYSNQSGNLTLKNAGLGAGGSKKNATYKWSDLMFSNGTMEKNITDAFNSSWIGTGSVNTILQIYNPVAETFVGVSTSQSVNPWRGYFIFSNRENITLLRQN